MFNDTEIYAKHNFKHKFKKVFPL